MSTCSVEKRTAVVHEEVLESLLMIHCLSYNQKLPPVYGMRCITTVSFTDCFGLDVAVLLLLNLGLSNEMPALTCMYFCSLYLFFFRYSSVVLLIVLELVV